MFVGWRHKVVKMIVFPKAIYRYNEIPKKTLQVPQILFLEAEKLILKFIWNFKESQEAETILKKSNKYEDSHFLFSKFTTKLQ